MFSYILRNTFSMDAKIYSKMPTENFFGSSDCLLKGADQLNRIVSDNVMYRIVSLKLVSLGE